MDGNNTMTLVYYLNKIKNHTIAQEEVYLYL